MTDITERQQDVLNAIVSLTERNGHPPTVREVADEIGVASKSVAHAHMQQLRRAGVITWQPLSPRTVRVIARAAA